jgi:hypothetical protein
MVCVPHQVVQGAETPSGADQSPFTIVSLFAAPDAAPDGQSKAHSLWCMPPDTTLPDEAEAIAVPSLVLGTTNVDFTGYTGKFHGHVAGNGDLSRHVACNDLVAVTNTAF